MSSSPVVWFAGVGWDDISGTDHRLVCALADSGVPVVWLDSPHHGVWAGWWRRRSPAVTTPRPGVTRLKVPGVRGFSHWPLRMLTHRVWRRTLYRAVPRGAEVRAVVVANPVARFPGRTRVAGPRVLYLTDDWVAGAALMGHSRGWVRRSLVRNLSDADAVAAVSPSLLEQSPADTRPARVIPNGSPVVDVPAHAVRSPIAGVVGQLNARLDLDCLEAVVAAGVPLRLIGPRVETSTEFARRLDELIARPEVEWIGAVEPSALPAQLAALGVGLTPYALDDFNRASFPLKTLEYLAAGLPVVSTDLPASRWLDTAHVTVADDPAGFARAVAQCLAEVDGDTARQQRIAFAAAHGWPHRADDLMELADEAGRAASG